MRSSGTDPVLFFLGWMFVFTFVLMLIGELVHLLRNQHELRQRANIWLDEHVYPPEDRPLAPVGPPRWSRDVRIIDGEEG